VEDGKDNDAEWSGSSRRRRKIRAQDQVDGGEEVCFGRCHCNLCSEGRRAEEKEEDEGCISSGRRYSNDSDASLAGGQLEDEEEEEKTEKENDEAVEELPVPEDQAAGRPESPAAKRQLELVQKTSEEALQRGLEVQRSAAAAGAKIPAAIKPWVFWPKTRLPVVPRYGLKS
jgi:hypothetical protein